MAQIKWTNSSGGDFNTGSFWSGGMVPGASDDAILSAPGSYTVTSTANQTVKGLQIIAGVTLAINAGTFTDLAGSDGGAQNGVIAVGDNTAFVAGGTIAGSGSITVNATSDTTSFIVSDSGLTLSGGGKVVLSDSANNYIRASSGSDLLTNVNDTISGAGQFGYGNMSFTNGAAGVLNASAATNALVINAGTGTLNNAGLIEATGNGGLTILSSAITQASSGSIRAVGAGHNVNLNGATITGGTLATSGGGVIQDTNTAVLNNLVIASASTVSALDNTYLYLASTITNRGTIAVNSANDTTILFANSATTTLTGAGRVILSDNVNNRIQASASADLLVNVNNTISGAGFFGYNYLAIDNQKLGTINGTGSNALILNTGGSSFTNEGLIEATGTGGVSVQGGTTIVNTGTILASGTGVAFNLLNGDIVGGTLKTANGGVIQSTSYGTLDGSTKNNPILITANSQVADADNEYLYLDGTISNAGTIAVNSVGDTTVLWVQSGTVTLTGGGNVVLSDNAGNRIQASTAGNKLVNVNNIISGAGFVGYGTIAIDNQALGVIDGTGANALLINNGGVSFTNEGLVEDTGTGGISIQGNTTITNAATATVGAFGAGSHVDLVNASIQGGTLATSGGGVIQSTSYGTLDGSTAAGQITITAGSQIVDLDNEYLYLDGTISNAGTIAVNSSGDTTVLWVQSPTVTLTGGGRVVLSDSGGNRIQASTAGNQLVNVNNTISGSGFLGYGGVAIDNQAAGTINSNGSAGIVVNTGGSSFTNEGLVEDTGTGGISIQGNTTITNAATATVGAFGAGAHIDLVNASIQGGTLATSGGGVIQSTSYGTLDGSTAAGQITITAGSQIVDLDNEYLYLDGTISNAGTIAVNSSGDTTVLWVQSPTVTLTGGGRVVLSDSAGNRIQASTAGNQLVNVNNTISGSGFIGYNYVAIDNQAAGTINSNGTAGMLFNNGGYAFTNEGLIEDTGTGGISIQGNTTITNAATATVGAFGAGSHIDLVNGSIQGGLLSTSGGGVIQSTSYGTLDGSTAAGQVTITANSQIADLNDEYLYLDGTISNAGTIAVNSSGDTTVLWAQSPTVTLTGGGAVVLSDSAANRIQSTNANVNKLVNVNNTISGAGFVGYNYLLIDNQAAGTIDATGATQLNIQTGQAAFTNEGLTEATGPGGLIIQDTHLTNTGTIAAMSDSTVTLASNDTVTNFASGTLTGGTWAAISAGGTHTSTLSLGFGPITTDAATLVVSGAGATITANGTQLAAQLTTIATTGTLEVLAGASFAGTGTLSDGGSVVLGGTLSETVLKLNSRASLVANAGTGTLNIAKTITNAGTLLATGGATLLVAHGTLNNTGRLIAQNGGTLTIAAPGKLKNLASGTLTGGSYAAIGAMSSLELGGSLLVTNAATLTLDGAGSAIKSGTANRALETTLATNAAGGVLNVLDGRSFASTVAGGILDAGTIALGGGSFSASGITIAAGGLFSGTGTLAGAVTDNGTLTTGVFAGSTGTLALGGAVGGSGLVATVAGTTLNAAGNVIVGTVTDAGTINLAGGTLSASSITVAGTLAGFGTVGQAVSSTGLINAAGGTLTLSGGESGGALTVASGAALVASAAIGAQSLTIAAGGSFTGLGSVSGSVADGGSITAAGGNLSLAQGQGAGSAAIANGSTLSVTGALQFGAGTSFAAGGNNEVLALGTPKSDTSTIAGFGAGTTIDLLNTVVTSTSYLASNGHLMLKNGGTTVGTLTLSGSYTNANFVLQSDGNGGTDVLYQAAGMMAATLSGDPSADLRIAAASTAAAAPAAQPMAAVQPPVAMDHGAAAIGLPHPQVAELMGSHIGHLA